VSAEATGVVAEADNSTGERTKWRGSDPHTMGDTKRGRERQGQKKREQLREREVERTLEATEEPADAPELPDEEIEFGEETST
jgi:hypothetical protein